MWRNSYAYYRDENGNYYDIFTDEYVGSDSFPNVQEDKNMETN